jgi:hypothetical protein
MNMESAGALSWVVSDLDLKPWRQWFESWCRCLFGLGEGSMVWLCKLHRSRPISRWVPEEIWAENTGSSEWFAASNALRSRTEGIESVDRYLRNADHWSACEKVFFLSLISVRCIPSPGQFFPRTPLMEKCTSHHLIIGYTRVKITGNKLFIQTYRLDFQLFFLC